MPVLGVCLGLQCIGELYGGDVVRAPHVMHGKTSEIRHNGAGVFAGLPNPLTATRYHSLVVDRDSVPDVLEITAESEDGLGDGPAAPRVPDRGRAVPPRVDPHRRRARPPAQLPRADARTARQVRAAARDLGEAVVEQRRERFAVELDRCAPSRRAAAPSRCRGAGGTNPRTRPWRCLVSSASAPRVAQRARERAHVALRVARGADGRAESISASSRSRPRQRRAIATAALRRRRRRARSPRTRSHTRRMLTSMPIASASSACAAIAAAV